MRSIKLLTVVLFGLAAVDAARVGAQQPDVGADPQPAVTDPLTKELERCKVLNEKAASDDRCLAAYSESRKRFFAPRDDYDPRPVDMFPKGDKEPWSMKPTPSEMGK